ncbi:MAG: MucB/RseB C-terminal domain-containing protein [Dokdonella sp.]|uniref:MucB/RseB C-terminal domain-containing protein n=1 Tax=Dokdonella sp. TaxID=2291710 RepID=UPI003264952A
MTVRSRRFGLFEGRIGVRLDWTPFSLRSVQWVGLLLFVFVHAPTALAQQKNPRQLLDAMSKAVVALDYAGSFVYEHNGQLDALRLFHSAGSGGRERLVSMSGLRSEIVRAGDSMTCLQSGLPTQLLQVRRGTSLLPLLPGSGRAFPADYYAVSEAGSDRVAGYPARILEVSARDAFRYGYRLWLDEESHLPLRSAQLDGEQRTLAQYMFVSLEIGGKPKESDLTIGGETGLAAHVAETPLEDPLRWEVKDLPPGFVFSGAQRPTNGPSTAEHHLYTDGVASVSLYVEPRDRSASAIADRAMARGAMHVYSRDVDVWRITAMGEVPAATVERIAQSTASRSDPVQH